MTQGTPAVINAIRTGELSIHAAVPLTVLPPETQDTALEAARWEADGKPTARITQGVVRLRRDYSYKGRGYAHTLTPCFLCTILGPYEPKDLPM